MKPVAPVTKTRIILSFYLLPIQLRQTEQTRFAKRIATFVVILRHSPVDAGSAFTASNSLSQSCAECPACSEPNNSVTALKNADNSRSAIFRRSAQSRVEFFDGLLRTSEFMSNLPKLGIKAFVGTAIDTPQWLRLKRRVSPNL